nr:hypothetical protein Iba_chr13cCG15330 [Ipomoea batatas]
MPNPQSQALSSAVTAQWYPIPGCAATAPPSPSISCAALLSFCPCIIDLLSPQLDASLRRQRWRWREAARKPRKPSKDEEGGERCRERAQGLKITSRRDRPTRPDDGGRRAADSCPADALIRHLLEIKRIEFLYEGKQRRRLKSEDRDREEMGWPGNVFNTESSGGEGRRKIRVRSRLRSCMASTSALA